MLSRYIFHLKSYFRNKAHPKGSIAEAYIAEECLTFCSCYFLSVDTIFNRPSRVEDDEKGSSTNTTLDRISWMQAHHYILFNNDEVRPIMEYVFFYNVCLRATMEYLWEIYANG